MQNAREATLQARLRQKGRWPVLTDTVGQVTKTHYMLKIVVVLVLVLVLRLVQYFSFFHFQWKKAIHNFLRLDPAPKL
jgi:hypothetical protein